jgi:hypothetical protein
MAAARKFFNMVPGSLEIQHGFLEKNLHSEEGQKSQKK